MAESLEFELQKRLTKIRQELSKREVEVRGLLTKMESLRVEALKKTEEMKYSAQHDMEKIDQDIMRTKDLNTQAKSRLATDISTLKSEIENKHEQLRSTVLAKPATT
jgi:hypothetical protein